MRERLWVRPLAVSLVSVAAVFVAKLADDSSVAGLAPVISAESIEALLSIMAASMLVIATFSVASMVSAYASASGTATPRAFTLVIADDASQNALSTFVGAFIFSVVAITAVKNDYYSTAGHFVLFLLTVIVFAIVILTFVKWVDGIARLGRMSSTVDKVEAATAAALERRRDEPHLKGVPVETKERGLAVFPKRVGYVQHVDMAALQAWACENEARIVVDALPGTFVTPDRTLAYVSTASEEADQTDIDLVVASFEVGHDRLFDDDPRFGLVVLSEIAGRALSPAVNDPGTAIDIVGTLLRLFFLWSQPSSEDEQGAPECDRVEVPAISVRDMFDDAFTAIARDGAGSVEVAVRLQKALRALAAIGDDDISEAAEYHGRLALKRARITMDCEEDLAVVAAAAEQAGWKS